MANSLIGQIDIYTSQECAALQQQAFKLAVNEPTRCCPYIEPGDSRITMQFLPPGCIDGIFTSPPYPRNEHDNRKQAYHSIGYGGEGIKASGRVSNERRRYGFNSDRDSHGGNGQWVHGKADQKGITGLTQEIHPDSWLDWWVPFQAEMKRILKPQRPLLVNLGGAVYPQWHRHTYIYELPRLMEQLGWCFVEEFVWAKPNRPPCTGAGRPIDVTEKIYWFAHGVDEKHPPLWYPRQICSRGENAKKPIVRNVVDFALGQSRWPVRCNGCHKLIKPLRDREKHELRCPECGELAVCLSHFAAFPRKLADWMVRGWSKPGDVVLDPFAGSGTVGLSAKALGRRFILMELNAGGEIDVIQARFEQEFWGRRP